MRSVHIFVLLVQRTTDRLFGLSRVRFILEYQHKLASDCGA
jgi:hypothetical protein